MSQQIPKASGVRFGLHICKLELADFLAELHAFGNILYTFVDGTLSNAQSLRTDADTSAIESCHCNLEALALFTEKIFLGNLNVVENELKCVRKGANFAPENAKIEGTLLRHLNLRRIINGKHKQDGKSKA